MSNLERLWRAKILMYLSLLLMVILASIISAKLEYQYIHLDGIPYREARLPVIGVFYLYHLEAILPLIMLLTFQPFIYELLSEKRSPETLRMTFAFGVGSLLLGVILEDSGWFLFRTFTPLPSDPLAHQWIQPADPTAAAAGYVAIWGVIIPLWYVILTPPIIAIFSALALTSNRQ